MYDDLTDFIFQDGDYTYEHEDFLDSYGDDQDLFYDYYHHDISGGSEQTIFELFFNCIQPTFQDAWGQFLLPTLFANFASLFLVYLMSKYSLTKVFKKSKFLFPVDFLLPRLVLILSGFLLLLNHYHDEHVYQLLFLTTVIILASFSVPILLQLSNGQHQGSFGLWILWFQHLTMISLNECFVFLLDWRECIKLRPNLMLVLMKSISYYHETSLSNLKKEAPKWKFMEIFLDFLCYLLHPSAIILGIWHPHTTHSKLFFQHDSSKTLKQQDRSQQVENNLIKSLSNSIGSLLLSILFFVCSTCLIEYFFDIWIGYLISSIHVFFEDPKSFWWWIFIMKFLKSYSISMQFHYSHYFICFLGQSMFDLWNFRLTVTKPIAIEWPRSLVDVVVAWNIPMHQWLKRYVFQILKNRFNIYLTILTTYFISSYLHGFNFQIWSVLLTLGLITQAEFKLRKLLSRILSACIESKKCLYDYCYQDDVDDGNREHVYHYCLICHSGHRRTKDRWLVRWINLFFTIIALSNLAFLGATFDGQPDSSSIINVWTHYLEINLMIEIKQHPKAM